MNRRSFIQRWTMGSIALGLATRAAVARSQANGGALTYLNSFATPTLTDTHVSPKKTARLNYGKHTKMAYCPLNGDLYLCGGDGQGQHWGGNGSGTMDTVGRYNVATHVYAEDFLYRGHLGEPVPRGLDFIAFAWAPSLKEFWLGPGYCWNYTTSYPWVDTAWRSSNYASYNPVTKRFADRGAKSAGSFQEGFAGSWDTKRDRLVWVTGQRLCSMSPSTNVIDRAALGISSHRTETADTWYDEETDELYFVQLATGKVYAVGAGKPHALRLVADTGVTAGNASSYAVVFITDRKHCLIVYNVSVGGALPWKLVNLTTGAVQHLNLFAPGCTNYNTGVYHPPTKTIVLTGGSNDGNSKNGTAFHHYRSSL